jgi:DNA-binding response OmpR family regulator
MRSRQLEGAMFGDKPVLIVEDNVFLAIDLSQAIEELDGTVVGPANRISHALQLLENEEVAAAIVDCHLTDLDVLLLTERLAKRCVPFILYAETDPPAALGRLHPDVPVLRKPILPRAVLDCLLAEMRKVAGEIEQVSQPKLGALPKLV